MDFAGRRAKGLLWKEGLGLFTVWRRGVCDYSGRISYVRGVIPSYYSSTVFEIEKSGMHDVQ
jgi:hypothetical protein